MRSRASRAALEAIGPMEMRLAGNGEVGHGGAAETLVLTGAPSASITALATTGSISRIG